MLIVCSSTTSYDSVQNGYCCTDAASWASWMQLRMSDPAVVDISAGACDQYNGEDRRPMLTDGTHTKEYEKGQCTILMMLC